MSEEEKKEPTAPQADAAAAELQSKYDEAAKELSKLQADYQKRVEDLKSSQATLSALEECGAIDWNKLSGGEQPTEPEQVANIQQPLQRMEGRILSLQFRLDNPDLKEYEDDIVVPFVLKARQANPRRSQEEILKIASDNVRSFLKKHEEAVLAKEKEEKAKTDADRAAGLEAGGPSTPEQEVDEDEARQKYVEYRRKRQAGKMAGAT